MGLHPGLVAGYSHTDSACSLFAARVYLSREGTPVDRASADLTQSCARIVGLRSRECLDWRILLDRHPDFHYRAAPGLALNREFPAKGARPFAH